MNTHGLTFSIVPVPQATGLKEIPGDDGLHDFKKPGKTDVRGMCPTLNTMANHGFIARNGITSFAEAANACQITVILPRYQFNFFYSNVTSLDLATIFVCSCLVLACLPEGTLQQANTPSEVRMLEFQTHLVQLSAYLNMAHLRSTTPSPAKIRTLEIKPTSYSAAGNEL